MNKIQKIAAGKRDFFSPKGRQVDDTSIAIIKTINGLISIVKSLFSANRATQKGGMSVLIMIMIHT